MGTFNNTFGNSFQQGALLNQKYYKLIPDISTKQEIILATYDGSGDTIHPSVVYFDVAWNGYQYWMANTPLPGSQATPSAFENPSIWASNDGVTWVLPAGLVNPIVPKPATGFNADTELFYDSITNKLYCFWKDNSTTITIKVISSSDGVNWSNTKTALTRQADETEQVSPSVIKIGSLFYMYYVYYTVTVAPAARGMRRVSCSTIDGVYGNREEIVAPRTQYSAWWHMDIEKINGSYVLVSNSSPSSNSGEIFTLSSIDGLNFKLDSAPLIRGTLTFDGNGGYRPTFLKVGLDYYVYYSAKSLTLPKSTCGRIKVTPVVSDYKVDFAQIISDNRKVIGYYYPKLIANVVQSANAISQITDLSVGNNPILQSVTLKKPQFNNCASFDGVYSYIQSLFTDNIRLIFIVLKQKTWGDNNVIMDGVTTNSMLIRQKTASPGIAVYMNSTYSPTNNDLAINTTGVLRICLDGAYRKLTVNNNAPISLPVSGNPVGGLTLGANGIGQWYSAIDVLAMAVVKYYPTLEEEKIIYNQLASDCGLPTI